MIKRGGRGEGRGGRINLECRRLIDPFVFITIMPTTLLTQGFNVSNGPSPKLASIVTSTFINCVRILVYFSTILYFFFFLFCFLLSFSLFGIILISLLAKRLDSGKECVGSMKRIGILSWKVLEFRGYIYISDNGFIRGYCEM